MFLFFKILLLYLVIYSVLDMRKYIIFSMFDIYWVLLDVKYVSIFKI